MRSTGGLISAFRIVEPAGELSLRNEKRGRVQWLSQVTDRNVHFVPVDYPKVPQDDYLPSRLSANDYPNLVAEGKSVDTVAAEAVLATYNWPSNTDRYR